MNEVILEVTKICKRFGANRVLNNIDLQIKSGEVIGLIGANGSGKSTFLKIVSGQLSADYGSITYNKIGQKVSPEKIFNNKLPVGFGFQFPAILEKQKTVNTVLAGSRPWEKRKLTSILFDFQNECIKFKKDITASKVQIGLNLGSVFDDDKAGILLSYGEARKIQFSRLQRSNPFLVILDEPTSGLESEYYKNLIEWILGATGKGISFLIVEHDLEFLKKVTNTIFNLESGALRQIDESYELSRVVSSPSHQSSANAKDAKSLIITENMAAGYNEGKEIFKNFTFTLHEGECYWFRGGNGSGKSTALRAILGLTPIVKNIPNFICDKWSPRDFLNHIDGVSYMPQATNLFVGMKVEEILQLATRRLSKENLSYAHKWVKEYFPEIDSILKEEVNHLSGGYRKMVAFTMSMITRPRVLLVDEPLAGLNPEIKKRVIECLSEYLKSGGSVILVEHEKEWVKGLHNIEVVFKLGEQPLVC